MKYTKNEIAFLEENYPKYGGEYCSLHLSNRSLDAIIAKANKCGLYCKNKIIHDSLRAVKTEQFLNIESKEVAYFLGYFWADGYIYHYLSNGINNWRIALEIVKKDALEILPIMEKIGKWSIQKRKRKNNWQETWTFVTNNETLYCFMEKNGYTCKSECEPSSIIKKIPLSLHEYFWKGVFDGDGSCGIVGRGAYLEVSSTYNYNYEELIKWIEEKGVKKWHIYRYIFKKGHKSSVLKIYGKEILKLVKSVSEIGLLRKNQKLKQIQEKYEKYSKLL